MRKGEKIFMGGGLDSVIFTFVVIFILCLIIGGVWVLIDMAIEWLKELKKLREQTRWTPISEKPPEENMVCLVAVGKFNLTQMAIYSDLMGTIDHRIFYQGDFGHDNFVNITQYVKAWMPLPKSYKPKESEE